MPTIHTSRTAAVAIAAALIAGCATQPKPPPPGVFSDSRVARFDALAPALRTTRVEQLFVTDRKPPGEDEYVAHYGIGRSRSVAYGNATVELAEDMSWDELVAWTTGTGEVERSIAPKLVAVEELGRLPPSPHPYTVGEDGRTEVLPEVQAEIDRVAQAFRAEVARRLSARPNNEVSIDVHGIRTTFEGWVVEMAVARQLLGRPTESIAYTWPAGGPGLLGAYAYDHESGEFTLYHLKRLVRELASMPEVDKIHVAAHSRGTDVTMTALRELIIEARAAGHDPREHLKLGKLVLLAPDLNLEVVGQRWVAERLSPAVERITVYSNASDQAIGAARSLFGGGARVGNVTAEDIANLSVELDESANIDFVFYRGRGGGTFGHSYYRAPAVLADIALMYAGYRPGEGKRAALERIEDHVWALGDGYPE